ncbi:hypothetical protein D3C86_924910 [compost metagenome]
MTTSFSPLWRTISRANKACRPMKLEVLWRWQRRLKLSHSALSMVEKTSSPPLA